MTFGKDVFVAKHFHSFSPSLRIITYLSKWQALHLCAKHYSIFHFLLKPMHIPKNYLSFFRTYSLSRSVMFGPISGDHLFGSLELINIYWPPFYTQSIQVVMEIRLSEQEKVLLLACPKGSLVHQIPPQTKKYAPSRLQLCFLHSER